MKAKCFGCIIMKKKYKDALALAMTMIGQVVGSSTICETHTASLTSFAQGMSVLDMYKKQKAANQRETSTRMRCVSSRLAAFCFY